MLLVDCMNGCMLLFFLWNTKGEFLFTLMQLLLYSLQVASKNDKISIITVIHMACAIYFKSFEAICYFI